MGACLRNRLPTIRAVHLLLAPALVFIAACLDRQYQTDFWHHLARGQQIVGLGRLLDVDVFTFTVAGQPLRDANWLTQVIYWHLFQWGGLNLVQVVNAGLLAITLLVLVRLCMRVQPSTRVAAIVGAAVFLGMCPFALIRPQTGSFLLFVLLLAVLMNGRRAMWLAVPIMALWANVHGGFAIGLLLIGAFCLSAIASAVPTPRVLAPWAFDRWRSSGATARADVFRLLLLFALCTSATFINPYGWTIYAYATTLTARAAGRGIEEWLPPTLASAGGWVLLIWVVGLAAASAAGRRWPTLLQVFLLACFVPLGCRSVRMVPWVMLATAPMMAEALAAARNALPFGARLNGDNRPRGSLSALMLLLLLIGAAGMSLPWLENVNPLFGTVRSSHRTEDDLQSAMAEAGAGRVFARLEWGDYLSFAAQGRDTVFCDGRIELYPDATWKEYLQVTVGKSDFERILDRWAVDYLILDAQYHATLLKRIGRNGSWKTVWRSGQVVLLTRSVPLATGHADRTSPSKTVADAR